MPEGTMLDRLLGTVIGGFVTFLLLLLFQDGRIISDRTTGFIAAVAIGAVVNLLWPLIMALWISRRAKGRRNELVQAEVQRQLASQQPPENEP
jgi:mannitol-specific phosphotransferase system IIBC component